MHIMATQLTCNLSISARCTAADASAVEEEFRNETRFVKVAEIFVLLTLRAPAAYIGSQRIDVFL